MRVSCKVMFLAATAISGVVCAPASAQDAAPAEAESSDSIVVTAQRREQLIQDVPISVSAFSAATIEKANITEAKEYLALAPNVSFTEDGETGNRSINIAIRGVSNVGLGEVSTQQSIGYYLDELSVGSTANGTYNPQLLDIERIEVLRGPQGTYFGRNASGGALNITTKRPNANFYAEAGGEVSRFDTYKTYGIVNVPLSDNIFFRGVASYETSDGIIRNVNPNGAPNSGYDYVHLRGAIRAVPTDRLTMDLSVAYSDEDEGFDATVPSGVIDLDTQSIFGADFKAIDDGLGFYPDNQRRVNHNAPEYNRNNFLVINNRLNWEGDGFSIRSITGYIDSKNRRLFDQDNISADAINRLNRYDGRSFSQELRVQSEGGETFDWVVGGLYANDRIRQFNSITAGTDTSYTNPVTGEVIGLLPPIPPGFRINENNKIFKTESLAAFADVTWHVTPKFELIVGGRYSRDTVSNRNFGVVAFEGAVPDTAGKRTFEDFSPRFVARYELSDDASVYASVSKGYKAGGVDINTDIVSPFSPERLWNYEVGIKGNALDNALQYSASVFYLKWSDLQVQTNFLLDPTDISSAVELTLNAAKASNKGFEVELLARLSRELRVSGAFGYLDSKFDSFPEAVLAGGNAVDLSDFRLPKTPRYTVSTAIDYERSLSSAWDFYSRAELNFRSAAPGDLEGVAARPLGLPRFPYNPEAYAVVNLRAGLKGQRFELGAFVENLFKQDYYTGTQDNFGLAGIRLRPHPRVWGLTGKVKFGS
ncbi:TonB-dependent receptor [Allosphingosinicella humi]